MHGDKSYYQPRYTLKGGLYRCRKVGAAEKSMAEVDAVKFVLGGFLEVKPYADMAAAFQTLHKGGVRVRHIDQSPHEQ